MPRRIASVLLLLGFLLAVAPAPGGTMGCGSMAQSRSSWTQLGGSAGGCSTSMPATTCLGSSTCAALLAAHELAMAGGMEHHLFAFPSSDLISHSPPPPQPPPPEA